MKRVLSLLLVLVMLLSCFTTASASQSFPIETLYVQPILNVLRERLLEPDSLTLRDVGCIGLSVNGNSYLFFAIQYVAKNKMGGYTDDWIFAISTQDFINPEVAVSSADYDISYGTETMIHDLRDIMIDYLIRSETYRTHTSWRSLPNECPTYDQY